MQRVILVDLDGTLNTYTGEYDPDSIPPPKPDTRQFLETASKKYTLVLYTARPTKLALDWLNTHNLTQYFDTISTKPSAFVSVDDRCLTFKGNYDEILKDLEKFTPYWKNHQENTLTNPSNLF